MKTLPILFKYEDIKEFYPNVSSFYAFVDRASKRGEIRQIKRGLYALVNPSTGNIFATKFQIASHLFDDAYFSYHEALEYYGLANQSFVSYFTYLTHVYVDDVVFEDVIYHSKKSGYDLEILNRIKEEDIRVVSLERAIVDSIDSPSLAGGLEEIEYALSNCRKLKIDKIEMLLKSSVIFCSRVKVLPPQAVRPSVTRHNEAKNATFKNTDVFFMFFSFVFLLVILKFN